MTTFDKFTSHLNTIFTTTANSNEPYELELIEAISNAQKNTPKNTPEDTKSYSLLFQYTGEIPLPQNIYSLEHENLGKIDVFLVPQLPSKKYNFVEAVFNA